MTARSARVCGALVACSLAVALTGCAATAGGAPASRSGAAAGPLTVFAAASLTGAFTAGAGALERGDASWRVTLSFAGSQQLAANVSDGAPADVIATASEASMQPLLAAHLVDAPRVFARNCLEIAVAAGNPKHVTGLADLARPDLAVVLADPSVPAGQFAAEALQRAGVRVRPRSLELDVKAVLEKVIAGDADAAIVYTTDVAAAGGLLTGVAIPASQNVTAQYPIAVVASSVHRAAALAFVASVVSGDVAAALRRAGFLPP